ncbi:MAG: hypothetical protein Ct9H300mP1_03980 [Planctomycetaceae bacterium]|nr:MAG: hypothetical protein Ct9H300mP1_03980 [Planctomycetaceae bacterium]
MVSWNPVSRAATSGIPGKADVNWRIASTRAGCVPGHVGQGFHPLQQSLITKPDTGEFGSEDRLEPNGRHVLDTAQASRFRMVSASRHRPTATAWSETDSVDSTT